jgi:superfamily II DNA/RNA helicase
MLDMGFIDDVERIAAATPATRQTLLFSATLDGVIGNLAQRLLKSPKRISVTATQARHENIEQKLMYVDDMAHKNRLLDHILRDTELNQAIVFTATKRDADTLADSLSAQGHSAAALHGDMNQRERNRTLVNLRRGQIRVLVATDVAARGIDVAGISHVINFDLPKFAEDYVHRIGRTGRGGATGISVSFASNRDALHLKKIEQYTGQRIEAHTVAGLEPKFKPRPAPSGRGNGGPRGAGAPRSGGFGTPRNAGSGAPRHHAPDSRHSFPRDDRGAHVQREGHSHNRFGAHNGNVDGNRAGGQRDFNAGNSTRTHAGTSGQRSSFGAGAGAGRTGAGAGGARRPSGGFSQNRSGNGNGNR